MAAAPSLTLREAGWYGGGQRRIDTVDGTGHRYKSGRGLVPVRRVFVRDASGTHRDEYFFTTDPDLTQSAVIGHYCGRWNIEPAFQEARSCSGLESTRGWSKNTASRAGPCLLRFYSVVAVLFRARPDAKRVGAVTWPGKATATLSDALCAVRQWSWAEPILAQSGTARPSINCPEFNREPLLPTLAPAP